jgi:hypothetical protein
VKVNTALPTFPATRSAVETVKLTSVTELTVEPVMLPEDTPVEGL